MNTYPEYIGNQLTELTDSELQRVLMQYQKKMQFSTLDDMFTHLRKTANCKCFDYLEQMCFPISFEILERDTIWYVKMSGYQKTGAYEELKNDAKSADCKEFDIYAEQPEHLTAFYNDYFEYTDEHGFMTVKEYYNTVYLPEYGEIENYNVENEDLDTHDF